MMKRWLALTGFTVVLAFGVACEDVDCSTCPLPPDPPQSYQDLSQRSAVLNNLELSYNRVHISKFEELLDQNFTFYPFSGDVGVGGDIPPQWSREVEIAATRHLFDKNYVDSDPSDGVQEPCKKIFMDVRWEDGMQWQRVPQDNGESWYAAMAFYNFQFDIGENDHFINNPGSRAEFTVRNAGTDDDPHWQLVEMRDLDQDMRASSSSATYTITWGRVKSLYR